MAFWWTATFIIKLDVENKYEQIDYFLKLLWKHTFNQLLLSDKNVLNSKLYYHVIWKIVCFFTPFFTPVLYTRAISEVMKMSIFQRILFC